MLIAFMSLVAIIAGVGIVGYINTLRIVDEFDSLNEKVIPIMSSLQDVQIASETLASLTLTLTLGGLDDELTAELIEEIGTSKSKFNDSIHLYGEMIRKYFPEEAEFRNDIIQKWNLFASLSDKAIQRIGTTPSTTNVLSHDEIDVFHSAQDSLELSIRDAIEHETDETEEAQSEVRSTVASVTNTVLVSLIVAVVLAIIISLIISGRISKPILGLSNATKQIVAGNLNYPIEAKSSSTDEISELSAQFDKMRHAVNLRTGRLREANDKLMLRERQLEKANEDLIKTERAKEEFISMVSHELKTPLGPAKGYAEMLLRPNIGGPLNDRQKKYLQTIHKNIQKMEVLVSDVLDVYKLDMGKLSFSKSKTDIESLIDSVIIDMKLLTAEKKIDLRADVRVDKGTTAFCDPKRIEQVLANLIKNSIDFVPENCGKIIVKVEESKDGEPMIQFTVEDNGIGIPLDKVDNLFKKFYQIDTSATRKHGGTGLGLVICKGIVEAHGGNMWIDKSYNNGLRVIFTLPKSSQISEEYGRPEPLEQGQEGKSRGATVLA